MDKQDSENQVEELNRQLKVREEKRATVQAALDFEKVSMAQFELEANDANKSEGDRKLAEESKNAAQAKIHEMQAQLDENVQFDEQIRATLDTQMKRLAAAEDNQIAKEEAKAAADLAREQAEFDAFQTEYNTLRTQYEVLAGKENAGTATPEELA